jgi:hypothetical protein
VTFHLAKITKNHENQKKFVSPLGGSLSHPLDMTLSKKEKKG